MDELIKQLKDYGFSDDYIKVIEDYKPAIIDIENSLEESFIADSNYESFLSESAMANMSFVEDLELI